jgi:hypothetical protein
MKEEANNLKNVRAVIIGIGVVIMVLGILRIGISIGEHRARFASQFGDNFERNFRGPRSGMMGGYFNNMMPNGNGAIGEIISLNLPQLVVNGSDNLEKTIIVSTSTVIRQFQGNIQSSDLKTGDFVVVIGNPNNNGQVEAKLIRVMPNPSQEFNSPK